MTIEVDREENRRWSAGIAELPSVQAHDASREEAIERAKALAAEVICDRLEHGKGV